MEKQLVINPYEKEYMKLAMLKHEQTFKEQVCELHRLYRIQDLLMKNHKTNHTLSNRHGQEQTTNSKKSTTRNQHEPQQNTKKAHTQLDLEQPAEEDEDEIELTLGLSTSFSSKRKQKSIDDHDYSTPPLTNSDSTGPSFSSSSTTGSCPAIKNTIINNSGTRELNSRHTNFDVEEKLRQAERLKHPPWIVQAFNLRA